MRTETNDDYYCPRCGVSDNSKQSITLMWENIGLTDEYSKLLFQGTQYMFNCGVCKLKSVIVVSNE